MHLCVYVCLCFKANIILYVHNCTHILCMYYLIEIAITCRR